LIPSYCGNIETLEILGGQGSQLVAARRFDDKQWVFPQALNLERIQLTLNGPNTATCKIPLYVLESQG
jgi:hypothetical protein